jgi:hypothetical protein
MTDYGVDMSCGAMGLSTTRIVSGVDTLKQDAFNLLRTPTGKLKGSRTASASGIDIQEVIGQHGARARVMLPPMISAALQRDQRIRSAKAAVELLSAGPGLILMSIRIDITPADGSKPFALVTQAGPGVLKLLGVV